MPDDIERIAILVVHGVGEQERFEFLESIASNLFRALSKNPRRRASLQLRKGDQVTRHSEADSWREAPVYATWLKPDGTQIEALFREVNWADLDIPMTWRGWLKLVGWALGISGVRPFLKAGEVAELQQLGMCPPKSLTKRERFWVRLQLFGVSLLFFLMLITVDILYGLLTRLSYRAYWLNKLRAIIYNYLGDVKLYQDWFLRNEDQVETLGEKSRVAIRRRMVRALAVTAAEVENGFLRGYYIFSHSLGTVVAFNALMEHELALPNYLTREEWTALSPAFKKQASKDAPDKQMPQRPLWLGSRDAIDRSRLFRGLRGFLTMGSPLDKFAAVWPAIVPVNGEPFATVVPWLNVADLQDIVAGSIDLFPICAPSSGVGGLDLRNVEWADQRSLLSAHTSYWKSGPNDGRLIDRVIPWLEGQPFLRPVDSIRPGLSKFFYWASFFLLAAFLWLGASLLLWLLLKVALGFDSFTFACATIAVMGVGISTVIACLIGRRLWEEKKFGGILARGSKSVAGVRRRV
jgi:hypothetical protein